MAPRRESVFLNVPFDQRYSKLFRALVFGVEACGFRARCALEGDDGSQVRIEKLYDLIRDCPLGIHDISRTTLDGANRLPRFNMPLELGLFLGAKRFGGASQRRKSCVILEREQYRYQKFCSDIAGQDVRAHGNNVETAIRVVRNWLNASRPSYSVVHWNRLIRHYLQFRVELPKMCRSQGTTPSELSFLDYRQYVQGWIETNLA
jgi:hypothetical protein